jgi:ADP-heptose:LPS heptosyltransferase
MPIRTIEEYVTLILSFAIDLMRFRHKKIEFADISKIVVIKLDHLGDVILSTPAIANIRDCFPDAHIALVVNPSSEQIARMIPYIDEIILYNARFFDRSGKAKAFDVMKGFRFAKDMNRGRFDLIVDLRGSFASLLYAVIANSKYRLDRGSYLIKRKFRRRKSPLIPLFQRGNVEGISFGEKGGNVYKGDEWSDLHEANVSLNILAEAGLFINTREAFIDPDIEDHPHSDSPPSRWREFDVHPNIVIHAGGPMLLKRWASERFMELIKRLLQDYAVKVFLVGGKDEYKLAESILDVVGDDRVINLSGKMTLAELAYLLKQADLFIGNDSGPMHIASACGANVIGLYGPTNPERFGPYGHNCIALRMEDKCPPCAQDKCKFRDYRCIDRISVDNVINVVNEVL